MILLVVLALFIGVAAGGEPEVSCPAPRSPDHGQAFLYQEGRVVKYVCEPGYVLRGKEIVRCVDGQWEEPFPACLEMDADQEIKDEMFDPDSLPLVPPSRPLFSWGSDTEENSTSEEMPLSDEARLRMVLYPRRRARILTSRIQTAKLHSASELEEEEKKRSKDTEDEKKTVESSTTIHLEAPPPSVVYVRRTLSPGKLDAQEQALQQQYRTTALHMTVDNNNDVDHVQVVSMPRAAVSQSDKGYQAEETLRHMYWLAQHNYPRQASLVEYRSGNSVAMTLSESQIAWINSLHPELRDQYLKDLYVMRAEEAVEGARAQAFLRRYEDAYSMLYNTPVYLRQPVSLLMEHPENTYDYTCHQSGYPFIRAPLLPNMHVARYDRRQNSNEPRNHYLSAIYRCNPGYVMLDTRYTELYCRKRRWIGVSPVCVPRG